MHRKYKLIASATSEPSPNKASSDQLVAKELPEANNAENGQVIGSKRADTPPPLPKDPRYLEQIYSMMAQVKAKKPAIWDKIKGTLPESFHVPEMVKNFWNKYGWGKGKAQNQPHPSEPVQLKIIPVSEEPAKGLDSNVEQRSPVDQPQAPIDQHFEPVKQPQAQLDQQSSLVDQHQAPIDQQYEPANQPQAQLDQQSSLVGQPQAPIDQHVEPAKQPQAQLDQQSSPVGQPQAPIDQLYEPAKQPQAQLDQQSSPVGQPQSPIDQQYEPAKQPQAQFGQQSSSAGQPQAPINQRYESASQPQAQFDQQSSPAGQPPEPQRGFQLISAWRPATAVESYNTMPPPPPPPSSYSSNSNGYSTSYSSNSNGYYSTDYKAAIEYAEFLQRLMNEPE